MSRKKLYWLCQICGWTLYAAINLFILITYDVFNLGKVVILLYLCFVGLSLTHVYRYYIHKFNWVNLSLKKLIPRIASFSILIAAVMFAIVYSVNLGAGMMSLSKLNAGIPIVGVFNLSSVILLWSVIYFAVHYFENSQKAEIESLIWESAVKDFEIKTLKSQLNPHFMFNALNSIRALIQEDPKRAQTAITQLSNILRYSLRIERTETVALEDELKTVADYLALESIRFEERLKFKLEVDPKSEKVEIPPMMIQTLVENAIKHGISKQTNGGYIHIYSKVADSMLKIQINNSGQMESNAVMMSDGFGINNTRQRLNLLYGEEAAFSIKNKNENEVQAELIIPAGGVSK